MAKHTQQKISNPLWRVLAILLILATGVAVLLYRDKLFANGLSRAEDTSSSQEAYSFENGAGRQFALMGDKLALASSTGLQLLDGEGLPLYLRVFTMKNPALTSCNRSVVCYDVGGTALKLWDGDKLIELDSEDELISASVNGDGYFAAAAQSSGYKGCVTVYDPKGTGIFKWYSGSGYVIDAAVSPDSTKLAVLCLESTGSVVHIFTIGDESQENTARLPSELAFELAFTGKDSLCLLSESSLSFFSLSGELITQVDFQGSYLVDYLFTERLCIVALGRFVSGGAVSLSSYSSEGELLGSAELDFTPLSLSAQDKRLLVLGQGSAYLYTDELSLAAEKEISAGYGDALLLPDGRALLLSAYHGEKISLR